ncbi:hypothetical protein [Meleagrid alphaherpesvirus 1]|uniref:Uncharacterized protein HVT075 n=1 Tax=Meleagrid herpesvirus 1 TaxID=37108 RepID=Q9DH63_MEHV1|nr:hypothetical protein [Meleagrid alphaherpesvirus 1]AAG45822.1 hypothetical protein [Meleagrid alphaherpesvirus 1]
MAPFPLHGTHRQTRRLRDNSVVFILLCQVPTGNHHNKNIATREKYKNVGSHRGPIREPARNEPEKSRSLHPETSSDLFSLGQCQAPRNLLLFTHALYFGFAGTGQVLRIATNNKGVSLHAHFITFLLPGTRSNEKLYTSIHTVATASTNSSNRAYLRCFTNILKSPPV